MTLEALLTRVRADSQLATWLTSQKGPEADRALGCLTSYYRNLAPQAQREWAKRLKGQKEQIDGTIYELVIHELLLQLGVKPRYSPKINGKTPDFTFEVADRLFAADVVVVRTPDRQVGESRTYQHVGDITLMVDRGERAKKFADVIETKAGKYSQLHIPLVVFVFRGDHYMTGVFNILQAVLGYSTWDFEVQKRNDPESDSIASYEQGLFYPNDSGEGRFPTLSAVVACDWFDTSNMKNPGKRLWCVVVHNWAAEKSLPVDTFEPFCQFSRTAKGPDAWQWTPSTKDNIVAKLPAGGEIEFHAYSSDTPW